MTEAHLADLERRVRRLEDELEITQLLMAYGPAVDSGTADAVAELWAEDGSYEFQRDQPALYGREGLAAMVRGRGHQAHLQRGCAHVITAPRVIVDGDSAVALCYSLMHHHDPETGTFQVSRVSANRWDLVRTGDGWRVARRTNRLLTGDADARDLFADALGGA
jgi:hypothetical protein